jgi:hypothetical protein
MGIFDAYQFNPEAYRGLLGGLLQQQPVYNGPQQQPAPQSWPESPTSYSDYGGMQTPVFGAPPDQPQVSASQRSAPPQVQLGTPKPQEEIGFGDRMKAGFGGFATNLHTGPLGSLVGALSGFATGDYGDKTTQTAKVLQKMGGFDPATAKAIAGNPQLMSALAPVLFGTKEQTDDIKEYKFDQSQPGAQKMSFRDWMNQKRATSGEFGMTPIWGTGPDGKPAILQLKKAGGTAAATLPEGFALSRDPIKVDGPTGTAILDPQTRQQVAFIPKDVKDAAKQKEIGEAEGQATVNLPTAIATAETTLKTIEQLKAHPGKQNWGALGVGAMLPDVPGGSTRGFGALVEQVKGQNFMTAFQSLKGAGAITEQEGAKAERAQARLDRMQSREDFDAALKDLEDVVKAGMQRARQKAGVAAPAADGPAKDLKSKYGLK